MYQHNRLRWLAVALAAVVVLSLTALFAACGGDDDSSSGSSSSNGKSDATKTSDSTGDKKTGDANPGAVSGTDKEYVKDVCVVFNTYMEAVFKAISSDPSLSGDSDAIIKKIGPPLEAFGKGVAKARPPKDVKKYHDELVKTVNDTAAKLKSGKIKSLSELGALGTSSTQLDPDVKARLANAEKDVKECNEGQLAGIGGLFGN